MAMTPDRRTTPAASPTDRIRMSEAGIPFAPCPRCGQERVPSTNGVRRHDEFCPALAPSPTAGGLDVERRSHFDGGKGVCVKDGEPMPCAALQSEATATGEGS